MTKQLATFLLIIGGFLLTKAQDAKEFQEIYVKTFLETSQTDFQKALEVADSLFTASELPEFKVKSLMLSATLYQQVGEMKKTYQYAQKAELIIDKTDNYVWQTIVSGFLTTHFRLSKLPTQSNKYGEKTLETAKKIENKEVANNTMGLMHQELALNSFDKNDFAATIENSRLAIQFLTVTQSPEKNHLIGFSEFWIAQSLLKLNQLDEAYEVLEKAQSQLNEYPETFVTGLIKLGLGDVYVKKNELDKAGIEYDKAFRILDPSNHQEAKSTLYLSLVNYYQKKGDVSQSEAFQQKYKAIQDELDKKKIEYLDESFSEMNQINQQQLMVNQSKNKLLYLLAVLIVFGLIGFGVYYYKQRKDNQNFKRLITKLNEEEKRKNEQSALVEEIVEIVPEIDIQKVEETSSNGSSNLMNQETEERLLQKLDKFEQSLRFNKNNISLSTLATYCNTNTKYLSYVINTYKGKDFNNYINSLRINYIIKKLKDEKVYRKYKIATLAEETGFSSVQKFSTVFKKETSLSPSVYIKLLQEECES